MDASIKQTFTVEAIFYIKLFLISEFTKITGTLKEGSDETSWSLFIPTVA